MSTTDKEINQISEERLLELIEASEAYPNAKSLDAITAYQDVALLLRELLERRGRQ